MNDELDNQKFIPKLPTNFYIIEDVYSVFIHTNVHRRC